MRYVTVTAEELGHLREGLQVLESLNEYGEPTVEIYFYGLTNDSVLLDAVREAVAYWSDDEIAEQDVKAVEAVIIFPASADVLYYLTGSGLIVRDGEAVYSSGGGEGPRSVYLKGTEFKAAVGQFKTMALSRDDMSGEDFLMQYGTKAQQSAPQEVERTAPAQETREAPVTPGREGVAPAKRSSVKFDVDRWLR